MFMRVEMPICAPPRLSEVSPALPLKWFRCSSDWRWPSLVLSRKTSSRISSFSASLLQVINGVMSLALCPQVVSQASQHFRSSEKQAIYEGCFASLSAWSFPFTPACPGQYNHRTFQRWMLTINTFQSGLPISLFVASSLNLFHFWKQCCPPGLTSLLPGYLQLYCLLCHGWKEPTVVQGAPSADLLYKGLLQANPVDHFLRHQAGNLRLLFHHYCVSVYP